MDLTERYFLKELAERRRAKRAELKRAAREEQIRLNVGGALGLDRESPIDETELVARIRALGYDGDTARIFDLLPLIHVAWVSGRVRHAERKQILDVLTLRGIRPDDEAWIFVSALLEQRPSDEYIGLTLGLLREVLAHSGRSPDTILEMCANVASAAGGFLGFGGSISEEEGQAIDAIARTLDLEDKESLQSLLG